MTTDRKHSQLAPSGAAKWLHCTASAGIEAKIPEESTYFAMEGTLAHAYCAKCLKNMLGLPTQEEDRETKELESFYSSEMPDHVRTYVEYVTTQLEEARKTTPDASLFVETKVSLEGFVPGSFGFADAIIVADGTAEVVDFKYGKGVRVDAQDNPQMMLYALGTLLELGDEYDIKTFRCTIIQPRLDNISSMEISVADLVNWAVGKVKPAAELAVRGGGWMQAGPWCRFCKARAVCPCLAGVVKTLVSSDIKAMPDEAVAKDILPLLEAAKIWMKGAEDYTMQKAIEGTKYDGWKLVEGRSVRKITDPEAVAKALSNAGYKPDDYERTELKTLTDLEKAIGKKTFGELCGQWIEKPQGKPTLVPESDKRPEFAPAKTDFAGLTEE